MIIGKMIKNGTIGTLVIFLFLLSYIEAYTDHSVRLLDFW